jgi:hypothetical protein
MLSKIVSCNDYIVKDFDKIRISSYANDFAIE